MHFSTSIAAAILAFTSQIATAQLTCALTNPDTGDMIGNFDAENLAEYDQDLADNGTCNVDGGVGTCTRVSCGNTSGIWVCNNTPDPQAPSCEEVAGHVNANPDIGLPDYSDPNAIITCPCNMYDCTTASGEYNAGDYSVIAAYANCGNDPSLGPYDQ